MADAKQRPDGTTHEKPQNQVGGNKGPIKGPQVDEHSINRKDTAAGSAPETRSASSNRS